MAIKVTLGGDRLGAGKKKQVELHGFERSTHNLSRTVRTTGTFGTLIPIENTIALPGDTWDIDLDIDIRTHPTIGPLFGSAKVQVDVFSIPIRLYNAMLHTNMSEIGTRMNEVLLPQIILAAPVPDVNKPINNQQTNPSSIYRYLGINGIGRPDGVEGSVIREFNAVPILAYYDICKNYYWNQQEKLGAILHTPLGATNANVEGMTVTTDGTDSALPYNVPTGTTFPITETTELKITVTSGSPTFKYYFIETNQGAKSVLDLFGSVKQSGTTWIWYNRKAPNIEMYNWRYYGVTDTIMVEPEVFTFPLANIDDMKRRIFQKWGFGQRLTFGKGGAEITDLAPYTTACSTLIDKYAQLQSQEGLALKCYQSDIFNAWLNEEWINGENGVNELSRIDVSNGYLEIDALIMGRKVFDMYNRVVVAGNTYAAWSEVQYGHQMVTRYETPIFHGGLVKELMFQEVIAQTSFESNTTNQPLGQLAGKGVLSKEQKGGKVTVKTDELSVIMIIASVTPRVDYTQGNQWHTNLKTMADFHVPMMDEIGFQDLVTDQMASWDTLTDNINVDMYSAGKQPAWTNYQTDYNVAFGNFAIPEDEGWMIFDRSYEYSPLANGGTGGIKDVTTIIDPAKYNHVFADNRRDAQNLWIQAKVEKTARRKMSAKVMPNL